MKDHKCTNCKYFEPKEYERQTDRDGLCHRFPPIPSGVNTNWFRFPEVTINDWCGEFKRRFTP